MLHGPDGEAEPVGDDHVVRLGQLGGLGLMSRASLDRPPIFPTYETKQSTRPLRYYVPPRVCKERKKADNPREGWDPCLYLAFKKDEVGERERCCLCHQVRYAINSGKNVRRVDWRVLASNSGKEAPMVGGWVR